MEKQIKMMSRTAYLKSVLNECVFYAFISWLNWIVVGYLTIKYEFTTSHLLLINALAAYYAYRQNLTAYSVFISLVKEASNKA